MRLWPLTLPMLVAGCLNATPPEKPPSPAADAFCGSIMPDLDRHSEALVNEGSDAVVLTGQVVIAKTDVFCSA